MADNTKTAIAFALLLLFGIYTYLNVGMWGSLRAQISAVAHGQPAQKVSLYLDDKMLGSYRLPLSDLFDRSGQHRINFLTLEQNQFDRLANNTSEISLVSDADTITIAHAANNRFLFAALPAQLIYILPRDDTRTLARLIWLQTSKPDDIIQCFGSELCQQISISSRNWSSLMGPFHNFERSEAVRGLPRGRWGVAPGTVLQINSTVEMEVYLKIEMLSVAPDHQVRYQGPIISGSRLKLADDSREVGSHVMYPRADLLRVRLSPGTNTINIQFSKWENTTLKKAVYFTAIKVKAAD